ncbi:GNAT family N-acetyltransferase [Bacillus sp. JCM 19041]|uniref:GNAT family N-acetyltransferase n=1 Tax=Bacillus sp. JCM 19041 TaxID=1460637 RepID=UPI0006D04B79
MEWKIKSFQQLSPNELYAIIQARIHVFVVEQACMYQDLDGYDQDSFHLFLQDADEIIAYARLLPSSTIYKESSIGRVITNKAYRGKGYGHELMKRGMAFLLEQREEREIRLQAEYYIKDLYKGYGFEEVSDVFLEDGIEHIYMVYK